MKQRWLVAIIGLPLLLSVLLACPPWATMLLVCAIAGAAAYELLRVAGTNVSGGVYAVTILAAILQTAGAYLLRARYTVADPVPFAPFGVLWVLPCLLTVLLFFRAVTTYGTDSALPFSTVAAGVLSGSVFPMMYACILLLRMHEAYGRLYVLAPFFVAFAGDSLAMYFGKWFGKTKMTPRVSPNKTWAGFYGSVLGSELGMLLFGLLGYRWLGYTPNYPHLMLAGAAANLLGQLGDLSTSLIKREVGVKDYSRLFLTHGGVLDRFDSTLFIAPFLYFCVSLGWI